MRLVIFFYCIHFTLTLDTDKNYFDFLRITEYLKLRPEQKFYQMCRNEKSICDAYNINDGRFTQSTAPAAYNMCEKDPRCRVPVVDGITEVSCKRRCRDQKTQGECEAFDFAHGNPNDCEWNNGVCSEYQTTCPNGKFAQYIQNANSFSAHFTEGWDSCEAEGYATIRSQKLCSLHAAAMSMMTGPVNVCDHEFPRHKNSGFDCFLKGLTFDQSFILGGGGEGCASCKSTRATRDDQSGAQCVDDHEDQEEAYKKSRRRRMVYAGRPQGCWVNHNRRRRNNEVSFNIGFGNDGVGRDAATCGTHTDGGCICARCTNCPIGRYTKNTLKEEAEDPDNVRKCKICGAGKYQDLPGQPGCKDCPQGQYLKFPGTNTCLGCPSGEFQNEPGKALCIACPKGKYAFPAGRPSCDKCPGGQYTDQLGSSSCKTCPGGQFSSENQAGCTLCQRGQFEPGPGSTSCKICLPGQFEPGRGSTSCKICVAGQSASVPGGWTSCNLCPVGSFEPDTGSQSCKECPPGKIQPEMGKTSCNNCTGGRFSGGYSSIQCAECAEGQFSREGEAGCTVCAEGQFQSQSGQSECHSCTQGRAATTGSKVCTPCNAGHFGATRGVCTACPAGKYQENSEQIECKNCSVGQFSLQQQGSTACDTCEIGKYQDLSAQSECKPCGVGNYSNTKGSTICKKCEPGKYQEREKAIECEHCPKGKFAEFYESVKCTICSPGKYQSQISRVECEICPPGKFQEDTGSESCKVCRTGRVSTSGQNLCDYCSSAIYPHSYQDEAGKSTCKSHNKCPVGYGVIRGSRSHLRQLSCEPCPFTFSPGAQSSYSPIESWNTCTRYTNCNSDIIQIRTMPQQNVMMDCHNHNSSRRLASLRGMTQSVMTQSVMTQSGSSGVKISDIRMGPNGVNGGTLNGKVPMRNDYPGSLCFDKVTVNSSEGGPPIGSPDFSTFCHSDWDSQQPHGATEEPPTVTITLTQVASINGLILTNRQLPGTYDRLNDFKIETTTRANETAYTMCKEKAFMLYNNMRQTFYCDNGPKNALKIRITKTRALTKEKEVTLISGRKVRARPAINLADIEVIAGESPTPPPTPPTPPPPTPPPTPAPLFLQSRVFCGLGEFFNASQNLCFPCEAGSFQPLPIHDQPNCEIAIGSGILKCAKFQGASRCDCPPGTYRMSGTECMSCPQGKFSEFGASTSCTNCSPGKYQDKSNATLCHKCDMNTITQTEGQESCISCTIPEFTTVTGGTKCLRCPSGLVPTFPREKRVLQSYTCTYDKVQLGNQPELDVTTWVESNPSGAFKFPCQNESNIRENPTQFGFSSNVFSYCELRKQHSRACNVTTDNSNSMVLRCAECERGYFLQNESCTPCPAGKFNNQVGNQQKCEKCAEHTFQDQTGQTSCKKCKLGQYRYEKSRMNCPPGTIMLDFEGGPSCKSTTTKDHVCDALPHAGCNNLFPYRLKFNNTVYFCYKKPNPTGDLCMCNCTACGTNNNYPLCGKDVNRNGLTHFETAIPQKGGGLEKKSHPLIKSGPDPRPCETTVRQFICPENTDRTRCVENVCSPDTYGITMQFPANPPACKNCPGGEYQEKEGMSVCQGNPCVPGTFQDTLGEKECKDCPGGRYTDQVGANSCKDCPSGKYKLGASPGQCQVCPVGKNTPSTPSLLTCENCIAGRYGTINAATFDTSCEACEFGKFQDQVGQTECKNCPRGKVHQLTGTNSSTYCKKCTGGEHQPEAGKSDCINCSSVAGGQNYFLSTPDGTGCDTCAPGKFIDGTKCTSCANGKHTPTKGMKQCIQCESGKISNDTKTACVFCQTNEQPTADQGDCIACNSNNGEKRKQISAAEGGKGIQLYQSGSQVTLILPKDANTCEQCQPGKFLNINSKACDECVIGTYQNASGSTSCKPCPTGRSSQSQGATSASGCNKCSDSQVSEESVSNGQKRTLCSGSCPSGQFAPANTCINCPKGRHGQACGNCQAGLYQEQEGQEECKECPAGKYTSIQGSHNCTQCPPGEHTNQKNASVACTKCDPGRFRRDNTGDICEPCHAGKFQIQRGQSNCTDCIKNKYQDERGKMYCLDCLTGQTTNENAGETQCHCTDPFSIKKSINAMCTRCTSGQHRRTFNECSENKCSCTNGVAALGINCPNTTDQLCLRCHLGFHHTTSNTCEKNTCTDGAPEFCAYNNEKGNTTINNSTHFSGKTDFVGQVQTGLHVNNSNSSAIPKLYTVSNAPRDSVRCLKSFRYVRNTAKPPECKQCSQNETSNGGHDAFCQPKVACTQGYNSLNGKCVLATGCGNGTIVDNLT